MIYSNGKFTQNYIKGTFWDFETEYGQMHIKLFGRHYYQCKRKAIYIYDAQLEQECEAGSELSDIEYKAVNEIFNRAWRELNEMKGE